MGEQDTNAARIFTADALRKLSAEFLRALGCRPEISDQFADHLVDADLKGVSSHGIARLPWYLEQVRSKAVDKAVENADPGAEPALTFSPGNQPIIDGNRGFGVPAMHLASRYGVAVARETGMAAVGVINCLHTGRLGAFTEYAADNGCLGIVLGGGGRAHWPQVVPHGGARKILSTNPVSIAMPGGDRGPVVADFATSAAANGRVASALAAGQLLPEGIIVDCEGRPTTDPRDYYAGGAMLPAAGAKGYGLAVLGELIGDAMLGARDEMNWLFLAIDTDRFRAADEYHGAAETILDQLRTSPPAAGFDRVEIPGEHGRDGEAVRAREGISIPAPIWERIAEGCREVGVDPAV